MLSHAAAVTDAASEGLCEGRDTLLRKQLTQKYTTHTHNEQVLRGPMDP